jgi:hypothetical protein
MFIVKEIDKTKNAITWFFAAHKNGNKECSNRDDKKHAEKLEKNFKSISDLRLFCRVINCHNMN